MPSVVRRAGIAGRQGARQPLGEPVGVAARTVDAARNSAVEVVRQILGLPVDGIHITEKLHGVAVCALPRSGRRLAQSDRVHLNVTVGEISHHARICCNGRWDAELRQVAGDRRDVLVLEIG